MEVSLLRVKETTTVESPLISVIICTYNRPDFIGRCLESVLNQKCTDYEVIIVDDGSDMPVEVSARDSAMVSLIRTEHNGIGAARSTGLNAAKGVYIAYCDDDDEWKPNHLSTLLNYLITNPQVDVVYGDSEWITQEGALSIPYSFNYDVTLLGYSNYIFASDVMHRAEAARKVAGFDSSLTACEDWDLWLRMSRDYVFRHIPAVLTTRHVHEHCVSHGDNWQITDKVFQNHKLRVSSSGEVQPDILNTAPIQPFSPETWQQGRRELLWHSILHHPSYGYVSRKLLSALEVQGVDIIMAPTRNQPQRGFEKLYKPGDTRGRFGFYYDFLNKPSGLNCSMTINYTMWESTLFPREYVDDINKAVTLQYVPCQENLESFSESGVCVPMKVLHHGVDAEEFPFLERDHKDFFTFGSFSDFSPRKGIDVLIRAFEDEFRPGEQVRLLLKSTKKPGSYSIHDSRISLISGMMDQERLLNFLGSMDAFVLPSRGEGFGLPGIEAMSTGLPLIATNWSGPAEYLDAADSYPLQYKLVDTGGIKSNQVIYNGRWAEPDYENLRHLMRWLFEHPEEAVGKGRLASQRVHEQWTWNRAAKQIINDLNELAGI